MSVIVIMGKN